MLRRDNIQFSSGITVHTYYGFELMRRQFVHLRRLFRRVHALGLLAVVCFSVSMVVRAQADDPFGDGSPDPVKLFERGQNAHARGDLEKAIEFYEEALKVRPEFAEAEYQRGTALVALSRFEDAEAAFRHTIQLRKNWSLSYSALGALLMRRNRDAEAEPLLRESIKLDPQNNLGLRMLADIRLRAGDANEALELAKHATADKEAPAAAWLLRGLAERATKDSVAALSSFNRVIQMDPRNFQALMERAEIRITGGDIANATADLHAAEGLTTDKANLSRVVTDYALAGNRDEAQRLAQTAGLNKPTATQTGGGLKVIGTPGEIEAANSDDPMVARKALETLLTKNPDSAMLLARLGASYRTTDATRSLAFYKRAATLEPNNVEYATGYGSALVQARDFPEAVAILRRVLSVAPDNYAAHANLATALYELKQFAAAVEEYKWLIQTKPDVVVAYYFIATAYDRLGEYQAALAAYESFLSHADAASNQLEIEKVNLRLPSLRKQIQLGQGAKKKTP